MAEEYQGTNLQVAQYAHLWRIYISLSPNDEQKGGYCIFPSRTHAPVNVQTLSPTRATLYELYRCG